MTGEGARSQAGSARRSLHGASRIVSLVLNGIGALAVAVMAVHICVDVVMRYLFNAPGDDTLALTTYYYMIGIAFMGVLAAEERRDHIQVTVLVDRLSPGGRLAASVFSGALTLLLLVALAWYGWESALANMEDREVAGATQLPVWPARFLVPLGFAAYAAVLLSHVVQEVTGHGPHGGSEGPSVAGAEDGAPAEDAVR